MLKSTIFVLFSAITISYSQDNLQPRGVYIPEVFAELLDVEVYSENIIFTIGVGGFFFIDISDMDNPALIGNYNPGGIISYRFYNGIAVGNLAIGAARLAGLYLIDINNMKNPNLINIHKHENYSYESVESFSGYAYAAIHEEGVEVVDISNPENPFTVDIMSGFSNVWDVFVKDETLYIADGPGGLKIYSLENPDDPQYLSEIETNGYAREVIVEDGMAFIALGAAGFDIVGIADLENPKLLSNFSNGFGITNHLSYSDSIVYSAAWELVNAVDVSDPKNPVLQATEDTPIRAMGVASINNEVIVADWFYLRTYDYSEQNQPDIHVKPTIYDFGFDGTGIPINKNFTIFNLGEKDLDISDISVDSDFFSVSPTHMSIPPGQSNSASVIYTPENAANISRTLYFTTNDSDESNKKIRILGGKARLSPGDTAPGFTLNDIEGQAHSLADYRGKIVVLAFFESW
jgi:hypothetical protein